MTCFEGCYQPLSRTAIRFPWCSVRIWLRRVVLPAPRYPEILDCFYRLGQVGKPVTIVMGTFSVLSDLRRLLEGFMGTAGELWTSTSSGISSSSLRFAITFRDTNSQYKYLRIYHHPINLAIRHPQPY